MAALPPSRLVTSPRPLRDLDRVLSFDEQSLPAAPAPEVTDAELARGALLGDAGAFGGLVARYYRRIFWVAFHVVGSVDDARDVVQESFVRLHRSLAKFDFGRSFYTWFYRIVMNLAIDSLRKRRAERATSFDDDLDRLGAPEEECSAAERQELRGQVWAILNKLDGKFKSVLVLRDIHGMSCREIAPILRVTHATVRWRLHRGRRMFREHWERLVREGGP